MDDGLFPIDAIRTKIESAGGLATLARMAADYYDALIEAGIAESLAVSLLLQWHHELWAHALSRSVDTAR